MANQKSRSRKLSWTGWLAAFVDDRLSYHSLGTVRKVPLEYVGALMKQTTKAEVDRLKRNGLPPVPRPLPDDNPRRKAPVLRHSEIKESLGELIRKQLGLK